jgi:hypothetical protein
MLVLDSTSELDLEHWTQRLDLAIDWVEVIPSTWLLYTSSSCEKWLDRMKPAAPPGSRYFAVEINPEDWAGKVPSRVTTFLRVKSVRLQRS